MSYQEPIAEVVSVTQLEDRVRTVLRVVSYGSPGRLTPPLMPGALADRKAPAAGFFELHRYLGSADRLTDELVYETYGAISRLPEVGGCYILRLWWGQEQLDAVRDRGAEWVLQPYPYAEPGSHDHCLLTWETIAVDSGNPIAYHSHHGWLTIAAYAEHIVRDVRRLRQQTD